MKSVFGLGRQYRKRRKCRRCRGAGNPSLPYCEECGCVSPDFDVAPLVSRLAACSDAPKGGQSAAVRSRLVRSLRLSAPITILGLGLGSLVWVLVSILHSHNWIHLR